MNSLELQEKLIKFQQKLRKGISFHNSVELDDTEVMRKIDDLLSIEETNVKPLPVTMRHNTEGH